MPKAETNVEHEIMKTIVADNGFVIKNQASPTTGKGRPDLTACIKGKYMAIEVKKNAKTAATNISQFKKMLAIANAGGIALYVSDSDDFKHTYKKLLSKPDLTKAHVIPLDNPNTFIAQLNRCIHAHTIVQVLNSGKFICHT